MKSVTVTNIFTDFGCFLCKIWPRLKYDLNFIIKITCKLVAFVNDCSRQFNTCFILILLSNFGAQVEEFGQSQCKIVKSLGKLREKFIIKLCLSID